MSVAIRAITQIQEADDAPVLGAGQDGYALTWDNATSAFVAMPLTGSGLAADGSVTGATSQAQAFTNGVVLGAAGDDGRLTIKSKDATMDLKLYTAYETFYGEIDNLVGLVYNWGSATTVQDTDHPRWGMGFEHNYKTPSGDIWDEFYLLWDDLSTDPSVARRPFMTVVNRTTRSSMHNLNGTVNFADSDGTDTYAQFSNGIFLMNNHAIWAQERGYSWLYQKDSTGNYRSLIYLTGADQYYIGNGILDIVMGATNVSCTKNLWVGGAYQSGGGIGVISIKNAATNPTSSFAEGGILYVEGGALKYRGQAGTVTTLAPT